MRSLKQNEKIECKPDFYNNSIKQPFDMGLLVSCNSFVLFKCYHCHSMAREYENIIDNVNAL